MTPSIHIVDYGIGNLDSVRRAIEKAGGTAHLTHDPDAIAGADRVLLPGVGAFEPCIRTLTETGLASAVRDFAKTGRPFLGICVGMQLLFDYSLEFGRHAGLGLIPGHVAPIPTCDDGGHRKVPHVGWSPLLLPQGRNTWFGSVLDYLTPGHSSAYFVHSYSCIPDDAQKRLADVDYVGYQICAAVQCENIIGFQCHPEKSGVVGLRIIEAFLHAGPRAA